MKKRKKKPVQNQKSAYKKFLLDLQEYMNLMNQDIKLKDFPVEYKRMMFDYRIHISNPKSGNDFINSKELKKIAEKTKRYYRESNIKYSENKYHSTYHLMLMYCYLSVRCKMLEKETGNKKHPDVLKMEEAKDGIFKTHYSYFILHYFRIITQLSNPTHKYYGINIKPAPVTRNNPMLKLNIEVFSIPAVKDMMVIDGVKRPTYKLGKATAKEPVEWVKVNKDVLGNFYEGDKETLDVYIQSHVIERLSERLDLLDKEAINYVLWENTNNIKKFVFYKGYLLLPFILYKEKVGYLAAVISEDKVLFRTFLFITHNSTPEGDKLKEITGLGKHDISYWKIDRLSTILKLKKDKHKRLSDLFLQAGLQDIQKLKEKDFEIDQMQAANLDGLSEYINKGQDADKVRKTDFKAFLKANS